MVTVAVWLLFDIGYVYELVPGFVLSGVAILVVSLLADGPSDEIEREFEDATGARGLRAARRAERVPARGDD